MGSMIDLTAFQQLLLIDIGIHQRQHDRRPYGMAIKGDLTEMYRQTGELDADEIINHGRLYPNLDELVDDGYLTKHERDQRTNEYGLTDAGSRAISNLRMLTHLAEGKDGANPYAEADHVVKGPETSARQ